MKSMADCNKCEGLCCKYVTVEVAKPIEDIDFEELKWYLAHENTVLYINEEDEWCLEIKTPCKYQDLKTNFCTIYEKRPKVCLEHSTEECEKNGEPDDFYKRAFHTMEDIDAYKAEIDRKKKP